MKYRQQRNEPFPKNRVRKNVRIMSKYAMVQGGGWFLNIATRPTSTCGVLRETKIFGNPTFL
jgi:hypothetical protein